MDNNGAVSNRGSGCIRLSDLLSVLIHCSFWPLHWPFKALMQVNPVVKYSLYFLQKTERAGLAVICSFFNCKRNTYSISLPFTETEERKYIVSMKPCAWIVFNNCFFFFWCPCYRCCSHHFPTCIPLSSNQNAPPEPCNTLFNRTTSSLPVFCHFNAIRNVIFLSAVQSVQVTQIYDRFFFLSSPRPAALLLSSSGDILSPLRGTTLKSLTDKDGGAERDSLKGKVERN